MIVEIVAVGTELLLGEIVNTNAAVIGRRLADEGFDVHHQVTVGDNLDRLVATLRTAIGRADAVLLTGGIGPTQDDLTRDALCVVGDREMTRDEDHAAAIRRRVLASYGKEPTTALRMADHPVGADPLPNGNGAALGIAMTIDGSLVFAVPGVPREMELMVDEQVLPRLRAAIDAPTVLRSEVLRTWGDGEARIAEALDDLFRTTNPSIAFLIDETEVRVRISAKAGDHDAAAALIAPVRDEVERRLGDLVFGRGEQTGLGVLVDLLAEHGWTVAAHEVGTAGLLGTRLAGAAGPAFAGAAIAPGGEAIDLARAAAATADVGIGIGADPGGGRCHRWEHPGDLGGRHPRGREDPDHPRARGSRARASPRDQHRHPPRAAGRDRPLVGPPRRQLSARRTWSRPAIDRGRSPTAARSLRPPTAPNGRAAARRRGAPSPTGRPRGRPPSSDAGQAGLDHDRPVVGDRLEEVRGSRAPSARRRRGRRTRRASSRAGTGPRPAPC